MEDNKNTNPTGTENNDPAQGQAQGGTDQGGEKTMDEVLAELAAAKLEVQKAKNERDKALKGKGEAEKNLRARMTAQEQEEEAKRLENERREEEVNELRAFKRNAEAKARYALQGMPEELATAAAKAEVEGDMDALVKIQQQHQENILKAAEAKWMKDRPVPNGGQGDGEGDDPFLKGFNQG